MQIRSPVIMRLKQKNQTKRMTIIATNLLLQVYLVAQISNKIAQATGTGTDTNTNTKSKLSSISDSNLLNPVVWESSSLYKTNNRHTEMNANGGNGRWKRSAAGNSAQNQFVDACESKMEVLTPYYATNSQGKLRTVINSELMQQAIQVETCSRSTKSQSAAKCNAQLDCGCEQKYKWHRLLVMDPSESGLAKGLFMDWFLFPSNCVCRCKSSPTLVSKNAFLKTIRRIGE